jgi:hypothetical protein
VAEARQNWKKVRAFRQLELDTCEEAARAFHRKIFLHYIQDGFALGARNAPGR